MSQIAERPLPDLSPQHLGRKELLRHAGRIDQIAGITRFTYADGNARGIPAAQVKTGSGLSFTVLEGRNMDIYDLEYRGVNFAFRYKNGLNAPERCGHTTQEFSQHSSGGMLYTSGLMNSGPENVSEGLFHPVHGRIATMGADQLEARCFFIDDDRMRFELSGRTRESRSFAHDLSLTRTITAEGYGKGFSIRDVVENDTCRPADFAVLYHVNFGYPFLDEGVELVLPDNSEVETHNEWSQRHLDEMCRMPGPIDSFPELLFFVRLPLAPDGLRHALTVNRRLGLAVELAYSPQALPWLVIWKSLGSGDYCLGVLPSTTDLHGRAVELERGGMHHLEPFGKAELALDFRIIDDPAEIEARAIEIRKCG